MIKCFYGLDNMVASWVGEHIGKPQFGKFRSIGVEKDGVPIAGVVYNNYHEHNGKPISIEISCYAAEKIWATRQVLKELFTYPFLELKVQRAQVSIPVESTGVIKFNEKLGFKYEGTGRKAHFLGGDMVVLSMLREECRWIA